MTDWYHMCNKDAYSGLTPRVGIFIDLPAVPEGSNNVLLFKGVKGGIEENLCW